MTKTTKKTAKKTAKKTTKKTTKKTALKLYRFSENNSGGSWWLNLKQYQALFNAGWKYQASEYDKKEGYDTKPFLFDSANGKIPYGWRHNTTFKAATIDEAVKSFERATGENYRERGCDCCGRPFNISEEHE